MLSDKTRKYMIKSLKAASWFYAAPYIWDENKQQIRIANSRKRLFGWCLNFFFEFCFESFVIFRLVEASTVKKTTTSATELVNIRYKAIAYLLPIAFQIATWIRWGRFSQFVNRYMAFFEYVKDNYSVNKKIRNSCDPVMPYIYYLGITIAALQSLSTFLKPQQITLFSSLIPDIHKKTFLMRLPFSLFHSYLCFAFCFKTQLYIFTMLAYTSPSILIVNKLRSNIDKGKGEAATLISNTVRSHQHFLHIYRCLQIQHGMFNEVFARIELPCLKAILIGTTVHGIYGCVKLEDLRVMVLAVVATASLMTLKSSYTAMGNLYEASVQVMESWAHFSGGRSKKLNPLTVELGMTLKSLRPLISRIGGSYSVEKTIVLIIMQIISEQTVSVLIAF